METRTAYTAGAIGVLMAASIGLGLMHGVKPPEPDGLTGTIAYGTSADPIEVAWNARLQHARDLSRVVSLDDANIHCDVNNAAASPARSSGDPAADLLMTVAEQPLVVFLAPGFEYKTEGGVQTYDAIRTQLADEIAAARAMPSGSAICLVRWATQRGFGEDTAYFTNAIDAVRQLAEDPLVPRREPSRIVVFGYSAGGNFASYAVTHLSPFTTTSATPSEIRLVTLGAPHRGAELATDIPKAAHAATLLQRLGAIFTGDDHSYKDAAKLDESVSDYEHQRGYQQLMPGNADVAEVNLRLASLGEALHHLNVYSTGDEVVTAGTATDAAAIDLNLPGVHHTDLPHAPAGSIWRDILLAAFGPEPLTRQSVQAVITRALAATAPASAPGGPQDSGTLPQGEQMTPQEAEPKLVKGAEAYRNL